MLAKLASAGGAANVFAEDIFSTYLYDGNGSTQTINNGIDLAGKGGMVWVKNRSLANAHAIFDTARGALNRLSSDQNIAQTNTANSVTAFNTDGFSVGSAGVTNASGSSFASWTFRKAPKFFDVVTYTGNGVAGRQIPHALGQTPGMIIVKNLDTATNWAVYHRSLGSNGGLILNLTNADMGPVPTWWNSTDPTTDYFTTGSASVTNNNGSPHIAYLFAHDTSSGGSIQCGSFTGNTSVNIGWEPQFIMLKRIDSTGDWRMIDNMRGCSVGGNDALLQANLQNAESFVDYIDFTATGFITKSLAGIYAYIVIRRPNKQPTSGTQVYNAIARAGTSAVATVAGVGFAPDLIVSACRNVNNGNGLQDRMRGATKTICPFLSIAEQGTADTVTSFNMNGVTLGADASELVWNSSSSGRTYVNWFLRRAPGVFDQICYTGTGANKTEVIPLLGVPAELWLVKGRSGATQWVWGSSYLAATEKIVMPSPNGKVTDATVWNSTYPASTTVSLGASSTVNTNTATYTAYFWATLAGISKVGTYTGNGTTQNLDMGFSAGARFFMVLRTTASTAQDIYIWDSVRGIVAGNDPHISLNTAAVEVTTDDSVDNYAQGLTINQVSATNINVDGAEYIYLAYA